MHACPITVTVKEGEMLYLPGKIKYMIYLCVYFKLFKLALWFHQVMQKGDEGVIAVNYWYDMEYTNSLFPTMGLFRRLITGSMEGNRELLVDEEDSD